MIDHESSVDVFNHLVESVTRIVAPDSLLVERRVYGLDWRLRERVEAVRPGDIILVRTGGAFYKFFRSVAGHSFDHMAVVLEHGLVLHVGPPDIRLLPASLLLCPGKEPLVLRPRLRADEREALVESLLSLVGERYHTARVYTLIAGLWARKVSGLKVPLPWSRGGSAEHRETLICTDAILERLLRHGSEIRERLAAEGLPPDVAALGSWSINDVLDISARFPDLLRPLALPDAASPTRDTVLHPRPFSVVAACRAAVDEAATQAGRLLPSGAERRLVVQALRAARRLLEAYASPAENALQGVPAPVLAALQVAVVAALLSRHRARRAAATAVASALLPKPLALPFLLLRSRM